MEDYGPCKRAVSNLACLHSCSNLRPVGMFTAVLTVYHNSLKHSFTGSYQAAPDRQTDRQTGRLTHILSHLSPPLVVMGVMQAEPPCPHCSNDMLSVGESPSSLTPLASALSWLGGPAVFSIHCPGLILFHPLHPNLDIEYREFCTHTI